MKYIVVILLANLMGCCSQKVPEQSLTRENWILPNDTLHLDGVAAFDLTDSGSNATLGFLTIEDYNTFNNSPNKDTTKVIMLVCDTSWIKQERANGYMQTQNMIVLWRYGYKISIPRFGSLSSSNSVTVDSKGRIMPMVQEYDYKYLDEDKEPLSKNIIIFQTKPL